MSASDVITDALKSREARRKAYAKVSELISEMNHHEFEALPELVKHHLLNIRDSMSEASKCR